MIWDDFYRQPALYDMEYAHRTHDVRWYRALASDASTILELGCGTGRVTIPMALAGAEVTAVDLCRPMLEVLQSRRSQLANPSRIDLVHGDFTRLDLGRRFELVVMPFNALQHVYTPDDFQALMGTVHKHLSPGGRFCLDVAVPAHQVWNGRDPEGRHEMRTMPDPQGGKLLTWENGVYDPITQIYTVRYHYQRASGERQIVRLPLRMFHPQDLLTLLLQAGLQIARKAGGFDGQSLDATATSMVLELMSAEDPGRLEY
jgi:SAM-dependent methyltransferase